MGKTEFLTQEIKISWIGFPYGNPDQWKSKARILQYLSYTVQHEGCISLPVTKLPVAKKKKGDTKIVNPVMRNYTLFWHFALSGIKNSTTFTCNHWYGKQFLQPNNCILLKRTEAVMRSGLIFRENPYTFPATIILDGNGLMCFMPRKIMIYFAFKFCEEKLRIDLLVIYNQIITQPKTFYYNAVKFWWTQQSVRNRNYLYNTPTVWHSSWYFNISLHRHYRTRQSFPVSDMFLFSAYL